MQLIEFSDVPLSVNMTVEVTTTELIQYGLLLTMTHYISFIGV